VRPDRSVPVEVPLKLVTRKDDEAVVTRGEEISTDELAATRFCAIPMPRRTFLGGLAVLGASILFSRRSAAAQARATAPGRVDVHHHLSPPSYIAELGPKHLLSTPTLGWTPAKAIEDMDGAGVATSITSITTPGLWFGDDSIARRLARECNEYAARLVRDHPGRFGMFVALPVPDIEGSLREIEYGLDVLKADGIALFTSYGDKWLGDPMFTPVFEELDRRKAVVYTHPTSANCCRNLLADVPDTAIEFGTDTTRAIARMVFGGAARSYPNMRVIFSHAGGTMPFLIERFTNLAKSGRFAQQLPQGFLSEARKFYYDTAQSSNPGAMSALTKVIPVSQIVFGTDFPFRTAAEHVMGLKECGMFSPKDLEGIDRENLVKLLPRYSI
jgi:predicted TIM-barrel fold metal-dependent hydrolase